MSDFSLFGALSKVEELSDGSLYVEGVASSEARDAQNEVIRADAIRVAIPDYMRLGSGALREMHSNIAAGLATSIEVRDDGKTYLAARVVDDGSCRKIRAGVLKGLSIGGKALRRNKQDPSIVEAIRLVEVSLVDSPCNPECTLSLVKLDANGVLMSEDPKTAETAVATAELVTNIGDTGGASTVVAKVAEPAPDAAMPAESAPAEHAEGTAGAAAPEPETAKAEVAKMDPPVDAPPVKEPAPAEPVKKGMEAYDAAQAIDLIMQLSNLLSLEQGEEHTEADAQVALLQGALDALKQFVASEIMESDAEMSEKAAKATGSLQKAIDAAKADPVAKRLSRKVSKAMSDHHAELEKAATVAKAAADSIASCHKAFGAFKDSTEPDADEPKKAEAPDDLQKRLTDAETATSAAGDALKKVLGERDELQKALKTAQADLARKGVLKAVPVSKEADGGEAPSDDDISKIADPDERVRAQLRKVYRSGPTLRLG